MEKNSSLEIYLEEDIDEHLLKETFKAITGKIIVPNSGLTIKDKIFACYQIQKHNGDFSIEITFNWNPIEVIVPEHTEFVRQMSKMMRLRILTDLPNNHPQKKDPLYWCIVEPSGKMFEVVEDDSNESSFLLDRKTIREL